MSPKPTSVRQLKYQAKRRSLGLCLWGGCKDALHEPTERAKKPSYCVKHRAIVNAKQMERWRKRFGKIKPLPQPDIQFGEAQ